MASELSLQDPTLLRDACLVAGEWIAADSGGTIAVDNPSTGAVIGHVPNMGAAEARRAIEFANAALPAWRARTAKERAGILRRLIPPRNSPLLLPPGCNDLRPTRANGDVRGKISCGIWDSTPVKLAETSQRSSLQTLLVNGVLMAFSILLAAGALWIVFNRIVRSVNQMTDAMGEIAEGNTSIAVPCVERRDEMGAMACALLVFKENAEKVQAMQAERAALEKAAQVEKVAAMNRLADDFEAKIGEIVETVSSASTELEASAKTLTSTADRSQQLATTVAAASEEASTNVQSVASATEELTSSVTEISRQVQESARMANEAVDQARTTNERVGELSKAAGRIGDVVELINTIAGQTNLLALNATIEAARAGEAGRGFAVVASEVKALAEQTAKATGEISQQISGIQAATQEFGERNQGDQRDHRAAVGDFLDHRGCRGRAGRGNAGNLPQRAAGRAGHPGGLRQYQRRPARRR